MTHEIEAVGPPPFAPPGPEAGSSSLALPWLAVSILLIAFAAIAITALLATLVLLAFYAEIGREGLTDLYEDFRFDYLFKTQVGAVAVGAFYASVAAATLAAARWRGGRCWRAPIAWLPVGGRRSPILVVTAAALAYAAVTTHLLFLARHHFGVSILGQTDYLLLGTFVTNLVVLAPFAEELVFRGWLYTHLRQRLSFWPSYIATAAIFAAIHWDAHMRVLLVLPLALALGFVREVTGSIKPTIALHAAYNLIIVAIRLLEI